MALNEHRIPSVLKRNWAWFVFRIAKGALYRRNAVIASSLQHIDRDAVLDIGAGEGYWIRNLSKRLPCAAVEPNPQLAQFVHETCGVEVWNSLSNSYWQRWIKAYPSPAIWLFSVLQYVPDPGQMLRELHTGTPKGTQIWVYQPIHQRQIIGLYARLFARWPSYESVQSRLHVWSWVELKELITRNNWEVLEQKPAYGKWGVLAHELWGIGVLLWGRRGWRPISAIYMMAVFLLVWLFNHLDEWFPPRDVHHSNGVWLKLIKSGG
jgi:hypothetical protein